MNKFDIVIIGSGLGGLVCAYILSKEGYNVGVLEKNHQFGGCLQTFKRDGCVFDTGMHYIGSFDKNQVLHRVFTYLNIADKLNVKRLDSDAFDIISIDKDNMSYKLPFGFQQFADQLSTYFPEERKNIHRYIEEIVNIRKSLKLYNLEDPSESNYIDNYFIRQSTTDFIRNITPNVKLQNILAGNNSLYAGVEGKTPVYIHALVANFYIESAYRFVDGADQVAHLLIDNIRNNGGTVLNKKEVVKILTKEGKTCGVQLKNGEIFESNYIISNVHPAVTMDLLEDGAIQKSYRNRIKSIENTISVFTLYASLKPETFQYMNSNHYFLKDYDVWKIDDYNQETWPKGYMLLTPPVAKQGAYAKSIVVNTYMKFDEVKKWENTYIENRGDDYLTFKQSKAETLINLIERQFPDIRNAINKYYTSTPLTYRDYTGTVNGSLYGISRDCNNYIQSYLIPRTKIPNLFLTGQNINLHGVLGVPIAALQTCGEFVGLNYLIKKIRES